MGGTANKPPNYKSIRKRDDSTRRDVLKPKCSPLSESADVRLCSKMLQPDEDKTRCIQRTAVTSCSGLYLTPELVTCFKC